MPAAPGYVVDASVAAKWLVEEEGSEAALALQGEDMVAPALLRIEIANLLRTLAGKKVVSAAAALELFRFFQSAPVTIVDHDDELERRALEIALEMGHPVYDCVYLALAERTGRELVTADQRFLRALAGTELAYRATSLAEEREA
jgi:predicted nucleic acid-binding protein